MQKSGSFLFVLILMFTFHLGFSQDLDTAQSQGSEKVIIISDKIGAVIDAQERDRYGILLGYDNFKTAIFIQLPDSTYAIEVSFEKDGIAQIKRRIVTANDIEKFRKYVDNYETAAMSEEITYDADTTILKLIAISEELGMTIDPAEREEYGLFPGVEDFEEAVYYQLPTGGYKAVVTSKGKKYQMENHDPDGVIILKDYLERYAEIQKNPKAFNKKWRIIAYDDLSQPITYHELVIVRKQNGPKNVFGCYFPPKHYWYTIGCAGCIGLPLGFVAAYDADSEGEHPVQGFLACLAGLVIPAMGGLFIDSRFYPTDTIKEIKQQRQLTHYWY